MKAYKGFNIDMTCLDFQYEEGKEYHEEEAVMCKSGFHACENPLDCFGYYSPSRSVYHEVELDELAEKKKSEDSKICGKHIKIGARLDIASIVKLAIDYNRSHIIKENEANENFGTSLATGAYSASSATWVRGASLATGYCGASSAIGNHGTSSATGNDSASSATGDHSVSSATGKHSVSLSTGYRGASSSTGDLSASSATGAFGASSSTGDNSASSSTGDYGASLATGNVSASSATGDSSASLTTGANSTSSATGVNCVALAAGYNSKAKASLGSAICICERGEWNGETYPLIAIKAAIIDGKTLKADTWYKLKNGEFVEGVA